MRKNIWLVAIILFIVLNGYSLFTIFNNFNYEVKLNGDENTTTTYGLDYEDKGFIVLKGGKELDLKDVEYDVISNVDIHRLGDYSVDYHIVFNNKEYDFKRNVKVVDDLAPSIETNSNEVVLGYCDNNLTTSLTYKAVDNYDGDITDKVEKIETDDKYILTVTDSNGNKKELELSKRIADKPSDKIELNGRANVTVELGKTYNEQGAYVTDGCGQRIDSEVNISGNVDTNKEGKYTITYTLKDNENIKATRVVSVYKETATSASGSKIIYLTFDDGPSGYTNQILNTLAKYNIKATFFVTMAGKDAAIKREYDEGHTVGLHTATHSYKTIYSSVDAYFKDLQTVSDRVKNITGEESKIIRFPGGTSNRVSNVGMSNIVNEVNKRGYVYFDWDVSVEDAGTCAYVDNKEECIINNFKKYIRPNRENIVLMHDIKSYTAAGLETMIKYALDQGYTFKPITMNTNPTHFKPYK